MWRISSSGRVGAAVCALALGLAACGGGDDDAANDAPPTTQAGSDDGLRAAVRSFWGALAVGDFDDAYEMLGESCQDSITADEFAAVWSASLAALADIVDDPDRPAAGLPFDVTVEAGASAGERSVRWGLEVDPGSGELQYPGGGDASTWVYSDGRWRQTAPCPQPGGDGASGDPVAPPDEDAKLASTSAASIAAPEEWVPFDDRTPDAYYRGDALTASCEASAAATEAVAAAAGVQPALGVAAVSAPDGVPAAVSMVFVWPDPDAAAAAEEVIADEAHLPCFAAGVVASAAGEPITDATAVTVPDAPLGPAPGAASSSRAVTLTTESGATYDVEVAVGSEGRVVAATLFVWNDEHPLAPADARVIGDSLTAALAQAAGDAGE